MDVLLRERRNLDSARAFFAQATQRRGSLPHTVVTDKHPADDLAEQESVNRIVCIVVLLMRIKGRNQ